MGLHFFFDRRLPFTVRSALRTPHSALENTPQSPSHPPPLHPFVPEPVRHSPKGGGGSLSPFVPGFQTCPMRDLPPPAVHSALCTLHFALVPPPPSRSLPRGAKRAKRGHATFPASSGCPSLRHAAVLLSGFRAPVSGFSVPRIPLCVLCDLCGEGCAVCRSPIPPLRPIRLRSGHVLAPPRLRSGQAFAVEPHPHLHARQGSY